MRRLATEKGPIQVRLEEQEALLLRLRDTLSEANRTVNGIRELRARLEAAAVLAPVRGARALARRLGALEAELVQPPGAGFGDAPKFTTRLATLTVKASNAQARPTRASLQLAGDLERRIAAVRARFLTLERSAAATLPRVSSSGVKRRP